MDAGRLQNILSVFEGKRGALITMFQRVQEEFGYLPEEALAEIARFLKIPESEVFSVATFYAHFYLNRRGNHLVRVCLGTACHVRGAREVLETTEHHLGVKTGETTEDYEYSLERVACMGSCALAPIIVIDDDIHIQVTPEKVSQLLGRKDRPEDEDQAKTKGK
jgi:NADH-quinone oxidoreductase subunit E